MFGVYIIIAIFSMLFIGDSDQLSYENRIMFGLFWPVVLIVLFAIVVYGLIVTSIVDIIEYFKNLKLKMSINKHIVKMMIDFNDKKHNVYYQN